MLLQEQYKNEEYLHFKLHRIRTNNGKLWLAAFTSEEEHRKGEACSVISHFIDVVLEGFADMTEEGIIINPWGQSFLLTKNLIRLILQANKERTAQ